MLHSNVRHDYVHVHIARLDNEKLAVLEDAYRELEKQAIETLREAGFAADAMQLSREIDLRYLGQQWDVRSAVGGSAPLDRVSIRHSFEAEYERLFGHFQPGGVIEITKLRVVAVGLLPVLQPATGAPAKAPAVPFERRSVYLNAQHGRGETAVYLGADLMPGHRINGPLLVEEQTTTVFVGPDDILEVDSANNFVIHLPTIGNHHAA
jgi:N-methylhydantoinase A